MIKFFMLSYITTRYATDKLGISLRVRVLLQAHVYLISHLCNCVPTSSQLFYSLAAAHKKSSVTAVKCLKRLINVKRNVDRHV